ncbi:MAG: serine hydrolase domain-containing protein [Chitinophagaceae bacterium]
MTKATILFKKIMMIAATIVSASTLYSQPSSQTSSYEPAYFADPERLQKIKQAFAVIDKIYKEHALKNNIPGFAYGIVVDGQLVHSGAFGFTELTKQIPATTSSLFRIASMTKSFTTLAILKLRDEGRLKLDDPAYLYIPQLKKQKLLSADAPPITIRHLMTHTAGFPEDNPWGDRQLSDTDKELIQMLEGGVSFSNTPGISYEYSNLGITLLGQIIKKVTGKSYQQYINENIFLPLGMKNTVWDYRKVPDEKLAHGYRWQDNQWKEEELLPDGAYGAMGGLFSTIEDFSKYIAFHLSAWPPGNGKENGPVKRSSLREMHMPGIISGLNANFKYPGGRPCAIATGYSYGLGWARDCQARIWVGHSGGLPGFGSQWRIFPDYGIGVVSYANLTYAAPTTPNLQVLDTLIAIAVLKPRQLPPSTILVQRKNELVKIFTNVNNLTQSKIFAENFFMDLSAERWKKKISEVISKTGTIVKIGEISPENNLRGTFFIEGEKQILEIFFTLTPEKNPLIQQLDIWEKPR